MRELNGRGAGRSDGTREQFQVSMPIRLVLMLSIGLLINYIDRGSIR